ncbi:hypothetical protein [Streptomyces sp. NPDC058701]|uniref:hypothetical protein n=1 Tax=Streptomyces sp. NPDC058701 TaxID=3346608 RepID=UPI00364BE7BC
MPVRSAPFRPLSAAVVAAVLVAGATGCGEEDRTGREAASGAAAPAASASASVSAAATGASPSGAAPSTASAAPATSPPGTDTGIGTGTGTASATAPAVPAPRTTPPPAAPTRLTVAVETRGGRLSLARGGPAQEFTVTLRNGNSAGYRHLLVSFQMEALVGGSGGGAGPGAGLALERRDPATGAWRPAVLRIAGDRKPPSLFTGGSALALGEVRVERYRLRANAAGPVGSTPVIVSFIDTDADREAAGHVNLLNTTR